MAADVQSAELRAALPHLRWRCLPNRNIGRDCGAAKIAYGAEKVTDKKVETETHRTAMAEFRKQVAEHHPALKVETGLMAINGKIEMFA